MKHIAAYLLLQLGGKSTPSAADITSVLEAAGAEVDSGRVEKLIAELEGKDINEVGLVATLAVPAWFTDSCRSSLPLSFTRSRSEIPSPSTPPHPPQLIAEGSSKLASVPSGGSAPTASSGAAAASGGAAEPAAEEKKEEAKEGEC